MATTENFPGMRNTTLGEVIIRNCTPKDKDPETYVAYNRFKNKWSPEEADAHLRTELRLLDISRLAQNESIDNYQIQDNLIKQWFDIAESYITEYHTTAVYPVAVSYLKRLFIVRENLPKPTHLPEIEGINTHEYGAILRRIIEEL